MCPDGKSFVESDELAKTEVSSTTVAKWDENAPLSCPPPDRPWWKELLYFVGPGFLVAMAYIDPGNLASDINQGAQTGYKLSWITMWCTVLGYFMQMLAARLGVVTQQNLAELCRQEYPRRVAFLLWLIVECGIVSCDMIEVIGGAVAFSNLSGGAIPLWAGVLLTGCGAFICLALESLGMRWLEWCLMLLIGVMTGTFCYLFSVAGVQAGPLFKGLAVPLIPEGTIQFAVGAIGAIIMPHNLYLHSSLVHTRCERASHLSPRRALNFVGAETAIALFISLVINVIIIAVFAATFFGTVEAGAVGLGNAGDYLQAVYGKHVKIIWAIGLLAAGNAATVTSTYAGQTVLDGYLGVKVSRWWRTAGVRLITLGPTLAIAFALQENSLDTLSNWLNIIQSLVLPFVVIPLLYLTSCKHIMGGEANKWWYTVIMGGFTVFLIGMNAYMFISMSFTAIPMVAWAQFLYWLAMFIYAAFVVYLAIGVSRCDRWAATLTRKMTNGRWPKQGPAAQCCGSPECAGIPPPAVEEKDVAGVQKVQ